MPDSSVPAEAAAVPAPSPPAPAAPPSPTLADRLKKCITVIHGLKADNPNGPADKDIQFLFSELLDLMQLAEANKL